MEKLRKLMFKVIPNCDEAVDRMWMKVQHVTLSQMRRVGLKSHLSVCRKCREYQDTLDWVTATLGEVPHRPEFGVRYKISPDQKDRLKKMVAERVAGRG